MFKNINLNTTCQVQLYLSDFNNLNLLLNNGKIQHTKTGKRNVVFQSSHNTFRIGLNTLSKIANEKITNLPIPNIELEQVHNFENVINVINQVSDYNKEIQAAENVLKKIDTFNKLSKEAINKSNIITRIFFFFIQLFEKFSFNLEKTKKLIEIHKNDIKEIKIKIKPFEDFYLKNYNEQKKNQEFIQNFVKYSNRLQSIILISTLTNIALSMMNIKIPYITKVLNTTPTIALVSNQASNAILYNFIS